MIAGGPYTVEISYVGYAGFSQTNLSLPLGETTRVDADLSGSSGETLATVVVTGTSTARKKTGPSFSISKEQIAAIPTLSRSLQDYTRLTPQANGNSFGGVSNRFNNIPLMERLIMTCLAWQVMAHRVGRQIRLQFHWMRYRKYK